MTVFNAIFIHCNNISTHILTKRMTAILNKTFSFKIKLYIHYNILFAIFYIYNSILYPFSSQKCSYSGANDSANYCSLAFRTPRFPGPSLQIIFPSAVPLLGKLLCFHSKECIQFHFFAFGILY